MTQQAAAPLLRRLIDDAAVFPPGLAPLDEAVRLHHTYRNGPWSNQIGPLLVAASMVDGLAPLAAGDQPIDVVVIGRPEVPVAQVLHATDAVRHMQGFSLVGIETGWSQGWREHLADVGVPVVLEVGRGQEQQAAIADLAGGQAQAKFRTGATPTWSWPDEAELAQFLEAVTRAGVRFKLTGGLHHVVRHNHADGPQHGLLNVLLAVHALMTGGGSADAVRALSRTDPQGLAAEVRKLTGEQAAAIRSGFSAYGCCGVMDPINELQALGLVEGEH